MYRYHSFVDAYPEIGALVFTSSGTGSCQRGRKTDNGREDRVTDGSNGQGDRQTGRPTDQQTYRRLATDDKQTTGWQTPDDGPPAR